MRIHLTLVTFAALTTWGCTVSFADDCTEHAQRQATIDLAGIQRVTVEAGAGELSIVGRSDAKDLQATGDACASSTSRLADFDIHQERRGDVLRLWTDRDRGTVIHVGWSNDSGHMDLAVELPANLPVEVEDGSGDATVKGVASLVIKDGSGDLEIADVRGNVTIEDGSGNLKVVGVDGDVELEDGSGEVQVTGVKGAITLTDGSGDAVIRQVGGTVDVREDGSGDLRFEGIGQDLRVRSDGSGSIFVRDVQGNFTVDEDGSGTIESSGVVGQVTVPEGKHHRK